MFDFVFDLGLVLVFCVSEIWSFAWLLCQFAVCLNCDFVGLCKLWFCGCDFGLILFW